MRLIISIIIMIIMATIANKKGFNPWLWFLAGGIPGFIILLVLPSANAEDIDKEIILKRKKIGNNTGAVITTIAIIAIVIVFIVLSSL